MKKLYILLGLAGFLSLACFFFWTKSTKPTDAESFIVGTTAGYAPWVSINEQGEYEGFDIDVMKVLAQKMNKELVIKDLGSMSSLFIALEQEKIHAIMWAMSITQDRLKKVAMVRYQGDAITSYPLLFWEKIPEGVTSMADMAGKTVCVEPASAQDVVLTKYSSINKLPTEKIDDALLNIQYHKADAALVEPSIAKKFKNRFPQIQSIEIALSPEDQVAGVGICIRKDKIELIEEISRVTAELTSSGTIKDLEEKWMLE